MDVQHLANLGPAGLRDALPAILSRYLGDETTSAENEQRLRTQMSRWTDADWNEILATFTSIGSEQRVYPANVRARQVSRAWVRDSITDYTLLGAEHLEILRSDRPAAILSNHLSYVDTTASDAILAWNGFEDIADRIVTAAGPKVYTDGFRRFAACGLSTIPVPQSRQLGHTDQIPARELARRARQSIHATEAAIDDGFVLQIYPEGSRSRSGRLCSFLKGVHRYLAKEGLVILPSAIVGTAEIFGVEDSLFVPGPVSLRFGEPFSVESVGGARAALARAHEAIAELLPESARPAQDPPPLQ